MKIFSSVVVQSKTQLFLVFLGFIFSSQTSIAQSSYPNRPIKFVVPYAAGGGADTIIANSSIFLPDNIEVAVIAPGAVSVSLSGGAAHDMIMGNELRNIISGAAGNDTLNGQGGDDEIFGGEGNDLLIASAGARYLDGGAGDDVVLVGNTVLADIMALFSLP